MFETCLRHADLTIWSLLSQIRMFPLLRRREDTVFFRYIVAYLRDTCVGAQHLHESARDSEMLYAAMGRSCTSRWSQDVDHLNLTTNAAHIRERVSNGTEFFQSSRRQSSDHTSVFILTANVSEAEWIGECAAARKLSLAASGSLSRGAR